MTEVGDFVYEPYTPQMPGKVVEILEETESAGFKVRVKFINGKEKIIVENHLNDFDGLIESCKKKDKRNPTRSRYYVLMSNV